MLNYQRVGCYNVGKPMDTAWIPYVRCVCVVLRRRPRRLGWPTLHQAIPRDTNRHDMTHCGTRHIEMCWKCDVDVTSTG